MALFFSTLDRFGGFGAATHGTAGAFFYPGFGRHNRVVRTEHRGANTAPRRLSVGRRQLVLHVLRVQVPHPRRAARLWNHPDVWLPAISNAAGVSVRLQPCPPAGDRFGHTIRIVLRLGVVAGGTASPRRRWVEPGGDGGTVAQSHCAGTGNRDIDRRL